jgi:hypothetical protein
MPSTARCCASADADRAESSTTGPTGRATGQAPRAADQGDFMDQKDANESPAVPEEEHIPALQQMLDNPFLLLFLGVLIPMVVYTLWGVIDILTIRVAK